MEQHEREPRSTRCPHCAAEFHPLIDEQALVTGSGSFVDRDGRWAVRLTTCPACERAIIHLLCYPWVGAPSAILAWPTAPASEEAADRVLRLSPVTSHDRPNGEKPMPRRPFVFVAIALLSGAVLAVAGDSLAQPAWPGDARVLRIAILTDEGTLQPYTYKTGYPGWNLLSLVYDTVLLLDADNVPRPHLAREVQATADGLVYTVGLRAGIRWHDGRPLTADDVRFTYEYFLKHAHSRFTAPLRGVDGVSVSRPDVLTIRLKAANPSFPVRALADVPILPRHVWEPLDPAKLKELRLAVGSGPYRLREADPSALYRLDANPDYFLGAPPVRELIFPVLKDLTTALQALRTGELQGLTRELPPEQVPLFSQPPFKVARGPSFASTLLQFNTERPPFTRREVRQAIDLAIDKRRLVDTLLLGQGTVAPPGFIHPGSPFHDPAVTARFDLARARQLLDQLGAAAGGDGVRVLDGQRLSITVVVDANNPLRIRAAELIAGMLRELGIALAVRALDANTVDSLVWPEFDVARGRNYDLALWGWSPPVQVDPGRLAELVHSDPKVGRLNIGGYRSADADRLAAELQTTLDEPARRRLIQALQRQIGADLPFVMLYFADGNYAYRATAYDGWVYQKGQGIYTKLSFLRAR
jgi:peptide/nickel transport system substrate-binding protein